MKKILVYSLLAVAAASQAQVWNEVGDAGDLIGTANMTTGVGPLTLINGTNLAADVDLYCIMINDEANFRATTVGGSATFDTQLWLFNANGMGVAFNDDSGGGVLSTLTSTFVNSNGVYYLGISRYDRDAVSAGGAIWLDTPFGTERAPDGPGAGSPLSGWDSAAPAAGNAYSIQLAGATYCAVPEPATMAALGLGAVALIRRRRK